MSCFQLKHWTTLVALELLNEISKLGLLWSKSMLPLAKTNQHLIMSILSISDIIFAVADNGQLPPLRPHLRPAGGHLLPGEEQPACRLRPPPLLCVPCLLEFLISLYPKISDEVKSTLRVKKEKFQRFVLCANIP